MAGCIYISMKKKKNRPHSGPGNDRQTTQEGEEREGREMNNVLTNKKKKM
jgi:hypothetical protein